MILILIVNTLYTNIYAHNGFTFRGSVDYVDYKPFLKFDIYFLIFHGLNRDVNVLDTGNTVSIGSRCWVLW